VSERAGTLSTEEAIDRLISSGQVLVGVDFDGTLAPIVDHPDDAVVDERALRLLGELARRPGVEVAVVSGRALDDLRARLGEVPGATLIGEHGNDVGDDSSPDPVIEEAAAMVHDIADPLGATVERKQRSVTFHYRNLAEDEAEKSLDQIRAWAQQQHALAVLEGKQVIELSTGTRNKGDAIRELAGSAGIVYIGDDATDETVFKVLGPEDVGIKVGDGDTAASHRVKDIDEVVRILTQIALASG
jgi:trehalose-phosphatase